METGVRKCVETKLFGYADARDQLGGQKWIKCPGSGKLKERNKQKKEPARLTQTPTSVKKQKKEGIAGRFRIQTQHCNKSTVSMSVRDRERER